MGNRHFFINRNRQKPVLKNHQLHVNILMILFACLWFIPGLGLFIASLRQSGADGGWWSAFLKPAQFTLDNYFTVLTNSGLGRAFINSVIITIPSTLLTIIIASLAAFPIAFYKFPGRIPIYIGIIALQIIPIQITLIPVLKMLGSLRLSGSFPGIWLAHTAYGLPFAIFLLRNFFVAIPPALLESARLDGASRFSIFTKLILPLSKPAIASLAVFQFLWVWNDLLVAMVYLGGMPDVASLTYKLSSMMGSREAGWHILAASAFLSMILPLVIFFSLQKYFMKGILSGAVKQ